MFNDCTPARSRFRRRLLRFLAPYMAVLLGSAWLTRHDQPGGWELYVFAALPAVAVIAVMAAFGRYLREETDEFQRMVVVRSLLAGTAAMLAVVVASDLLRALGPSRALPPFVSFIVFCVAFSVAQLVQTVRNRPEADDDKPLA